MFVTFANSLGLPVKQVDKDGNPISDNNGNPLFVPGVFRHFFMDGNQMVSTKLPMPRLEGIWRMKIEKSEFQGRPFYRVLGMSSASQVSDIGALKDVTF